MVLAGNEIAGSIPTLFGNFSKIGKSRSMAQKSTAFPSRDLTVISLALTIYSHTLRNNGIVSKFINWIDSIGSYAANSTE